MTRAWRGVGLGLTLLLAGCGGGRMAGPIGESASLECAPYARQVSGIQLRGAADGWWREAEGRYARASAPVPGSVLVFRATARLPYGHVSVVSRVVSSRQIVVAQANWVHHRVGSADPVLDVSPGNDWTAVRVWWEPSGALGVTRYPTYGFVLPEPPGGPAAADLTGAGGLQAAPELAMSARDAWRGPADRP